jgi:hypothetical protein
MHTPPDQACRPCTQSALLYRRGIHLAVGCALRQGVRVSLADARAMASAGGPIIGLRIMSSAVPTHACPYLELREVDGSVTLPD